MLNYIFCTVFNKNIGKIMFFFQKVWVGFLIYGVYFTILSYSAQQVVAQRLQDLKCLWHSINYFDPPLGIYLISHPFTVLRIKVKSKIETIKKLGTLPRTLTSSGKLRYLHKQRQLAVKESTLLLYFTCLSEASIS